MKRAFLFGLAAQLLVIGAIFLFFGDQMLPMTRSPLIGVIALGAGAASAFFAWSATPHPSWIARIGLWIVGFLAVYAVIPVIELVGVLTIALFRTETLSQRSLRLTAYKDFFISLSQQAFSEGPLP